MSMTKFPVAQRQQTSTDLTPTPRDNASGDTTWRVDCESYRPFLVGVPTRSLLSFSSRCANVSVTNRFAYCRRSTIRQPTKIEMSKSARRAMYSSTSIRLTVSIPTSPTLWQTLTAEWSRDQQWDLDDVGPIVWAPRPSPAFSSQLTSVCYAWQMQSTANSRTIPTIIICPPTTVGVIVWRAPNAGGLRRMYD